MSQKNNPYYPYPPWFSKYGDPETLEKFPYGEYLKGRIIDNISLYKKLGLDRKVKIRCSVCDFEYETINPNKGSCPYCKAPKNYNLNEMKKWVI